MNAMVEDGDSDRERANVYHTRHIPVDPGEVNFYRRWSDAESEDDLGRGAGTRERDDMKTPTHRLKEMRHRATKLERDTPHRRSRRHTSRRYPPERNNTDRSHDEDQDSDDVMKDYYGGKEDSRFQYRPGISYDHGGDWDYGMHYLRPNRIDQEGELYPLPPSVQSRPPVYVSGTGEGPHYSIPFHRSSSEARPVRIPDKNMIEEKPPNAPMGGLWARAAVPISSKSPDDLRVTLKLVLTRKGERYKGRPIPYKVGSWPDDASFARRLLKEYRSLKTENIGLIQKITAYKTISFIYFLQYRAFNAKGFRFGRWEITERLPIIPREDEKAKSFFMYQLQRKVRKQSKLLSSLSDIPCTKKPARDWIRRLEGLIQPGAVIDIEVKETFDSKKIYLGLLVAILLSLGVALAYGFAMDNDFSTGFSIASWLLTAFGFFAAVVAAGEYLGLDSPTATLSAAEELQAGRRLGHDMIDPKKESGW